ncbi:MAG: DNA translocase FtsK 4TM domain-containing protein [Bacteroidales bacterium]
MAKKNTEVKKGRTKKIVLFLQSEMTHFFIGLFLLLFSIFLFFAFVSFFFTGDYDQSFILNRNLSDIISAPHEITNWTGAIGAFLSEYFINQGFGISVFFILYFVFQMALDQMKIKSLSKYASFIWSVVAMVWGSVVLALIVLPFNSSTFLFLGGAHGFWIMDKLRLFLGLPGTILLIFGISVLLAAIRNHKVMDRIRSLFFIRLKRKKNETEEQMKTKEFSASTAVDAFGSSDTELEESEPVTPISAVKDSLVEDEVKELFETRKDETDFDDAGFDQPNQKDEAFYEEDDFDVLPSNVGNTEAGGSLNKKQQVSNEPNVQIEAGYSEESEIYDGTEMSDYDPTLDLSRYKYPSPDLLRKYDDSEMAVNEEEQNTNIRRIRETLEHYGITISSIKATVGPTITLYEIVPAPGIRISKIRNLEDDIALSLAALGIRIIAPIPGKGTVGIEVPNKNPQIVSMQSILASKKFNESKYDLPIALGKTITNEIFMIDLCKMPHVLVAGATGQGKSVGLNAIITSLLYKKHPSQLKFVLVDPKKVEFNIYSLIEKHFLAKLPDAEEAIITDVTKVVQTLNSITREMDTRYDLLKKAHTRNIKEYNAKFVARKLNPENGHKYMPYIVVIIDEFGDLIMTAGKEVELPIARIAQLARAVGIHMVIATQRPSTNIITGTIKANFPARVAFRVSSMIDSRTILDCPGANQLIGRGDLLFSQGSELSRVQCAFVDTPEVEEVVEFIGNQQGYPTAFLLPEYEGDTSEGGIGSIDMSDKDPLFEDAARLIVANQQGSTSLLQRKMSLGYNRAGRIMDQLEAAGIVGPFEGSKARQVLVMDETHLEMVLNNLK